MKQSHGFWFPDCDTHFAKMLDKNVAKGNQPVYQEPVRRISIQHCLHRNLALDIGANVGLWTRDLCGFFNQVIAIEPVAEFRDCLRKNVTTDNLQIYDCALSESASMIDMIITPENTGHSHVDPASMGNGSIKMQTLDSLNLPKFEYVKIDCEGYEFKILRGGEQCIRKYCPIIVVEQKFHTDTGIVDQGEAIALLRSWGARQLDQVKNDIVMGWAG